jgi:DNA-binding NtrC family response regulator
MNKTQLRLLFVESCTYDSEQILRLCTPLSNLFHVEHISTFAQAKSLLTTGPFDAVLTGLSLIDADGLDVIHKLKQCAPTIPIVVIAHQVHEYIAQTATQHGAQSYLITERLNPQQLLLTLLDTSLKSGQQPETGFPEPLHIPHHSRRFITA